MAERPKPGSIVHVEFDVKEPKKVEKFYGNLFGWKFTPVPGMEYSLFEAPSGPRREPVTVEDRDHGNETRQHRARRAPLRGPREVEGDLRRGLRVEVPGVPGAELFHVEGAERPRRGPHEGDGGAAPAGAELHPLEGHRRDEPPDCGLGRRDHPAEDGDPRPGLVGALPGAGRDDDGPLREPDATARGPEAEAGREEGEAGGQEAEVSGLAVVHGEGRSMEGPAFERWIPIAKQVVRRSLGLRWKDVFEIYAYPPTIPLAEALALEARRAGSDTHITLMTDDLWFTSMRELSTKWLRQASPAEFAIHDAITADIYLGGPADARRMQDIPPEKFDANSKGNERQDEPLRRRRVRHVDLPIGRLTPERAEAYGLDYGRWDASYR